MVYLVAHEKCHVGWSTFNKSTPRMTKGGYFMSAPEILGCCLHWGGKVRRDDALEVPVARNVLNPPPRLHHSASAQRP